MKKLYLIRNILVDCSLGELYWDSGDLECYTMEDLDRFLSSEMSLSTILSKKIPENTAIPYGNYQVLITHSMRFGKMMPQLIDVLGFDGIRMHIGNKKEDVAGCIATGRNLAVEYGVGSVYKSGEAFKEFFKKLEDTLKREKVFIKVMANYNKNLLELYNV